MPRSHAVRRAAAMRCCSPCWPRPRPAFAQDAIRRAAGRRAAAGRDRSRGAAGRAHLHARRLRPLRAAQRARHAEQRAGLRDRRERHRAARPRPGDRQRADQRRALLGQVDRHLHRAAADQRQQRRPDRDRRRRHAEHFRPDRPGRQRRSPLSRGLSGNFVWRPQIRARRTPARLLNGEVSINGSLGRHPIYAEPAQRQLPQRQCRARSW